MRSVASKDILYTHDFGTKDMRTGVIPFGSAKGYGLTAKQKKALSSQFADTKPGELDARRLMPMADRAKAMVVRLFEDVANFAQNPLEQANLIEALNKGISFGRERGLQLVNSLNSFKENIEKANTEKSFVNPLQMSTINSKTPASVLV